jgi:hypothetical protein
LTPVPLAAADLTVNAACKLPRRIDFAVDSRRVGSSPSNPGGSRHRNSIPLALTLRISHNHDRSASAASLRPNPVIDDSINTLFHLLPPPSYFPLPIVGRAGVGGLFAAKTNLLVAMRLGIAPRRRSSRQTERQKAFD